MVRAASGEVEAPVGSALGTKRDLLEAKVRTEERV